MSFSRLGVFFLIALSLSSCGLKVGEKPADVKPIRVGRVGFGCMGNISQTVRSYVLAEMNATQVTYFFDCMKFSFVSFGNYMKLEQKDRNIYAATEIRDFLQRYFIRDRVITNELLHEFMNLKKVMVGGNVDRVTKAELMRGVEVLEELKEEALKLNKYMPILNSFVGVKNKTDGVPLPSTMEAIKALKDAAERVGEIMATSHQSYSLESLERFLTAFRQFVQWDEQFLSAKSPRKWINFFKVFKALAVRPPKDVIEPQEWPRLMSASAGWYAVYLRYLFELEGRSVFYGKGLSELKGLFNDAILMVSKSVESQPRKVIDFDQLDKLFDVLGELEILPGNLKPQTLKQVSRPLFQKIFVDLSDTLAEKQKAPHGIQISTLRQIQTEFERWHAVQANLDELFVPNPELQGFTYDQVLNKRNTVEISPELDRIWDKVRPLFRDGEYRVFLTEEKNFKKYDVVQNFHNLSLMNLMRGGIRLVIRGYAQDPRRLIRMMGVTEDEVESFYVDFKPLGVDLKFMDPNGCKVGLRAFLESNLFTYLGDGINPPDEKNPKANLMTYEEGIEYLSFLTSGALMARELRRNMKPACRDIGIDVYGDPAFSRKCFRENVRQYMVPMLVNMPGMKKYLEKVSDKKWLIFLDALLKAALKTESELMEVGDISTFFVILHYVEAIMTRYDVMTDGVLTVGEARLAFPVFNGMIKKLAKTLMDKDLTDMRSQAVLSFILANKSLPMDWWSQTEAVTNQYFYNWSYKLDRTDLAEVFGVIIEKITRPQGDGASQCK